MKTRTKRIFAIGVLVVCVALIANLVVAQPILNKAIVVGMGIDQTEKGEIEVTVQIAVAGESSAPGAPNRYAIMSGTAPTLIGAMDKIARTTAYKPAYFHCHMVIFGERLVKNGVRERATELFIEDSVMDDVSVMAVKGTAKETLERSVSVQGASSVYLQQLNKINSSTGGHPTATLKSFVTNFETKGFTPYLPWVEAIPVPKAIGGADTGGDEQNYAFDCSKTVLFYDDGRGVVAGEDVTAAIGLSGQAEGMLLPIRTDEGFMDVNIKRSEAWWKIDKSGKISLCSIYFVNIITQSVAESAKDIPDAFVVSHVKKYIRETMTKAYLGERELGLDIFSLAGKYHKKFGEKREPQGLSLDLKLAVRLGDA